MNEIMTNKAKMDEMMTKAHGRKASSVMMAHQGMSEFMGGANMNINPMNPFQSEAQRRFLWTHHPEIAKKWAHEGKNKGLPYHKKKK